jgi:hypothetical protein
VIVIEKTLRRRPGVKSVERHSNLYRDWNLKPPSNPNKNKPQVLPRQFLGLAVARPRTKSGQANGWVPENEAAENVVVFCEAAGAEPLLDRRRILIQPRYH